MPRAFQVDLPDAADGVDEFYLATERRMAGSNIRRHTTTCQKGRRGKYMCRLARPAGVHDAPTQPLLIHRERGGDMSKGVRPILQGYPLDAEECSIIDSGYDVRNGKLFPRRLAGPVLWELRRPARDSFVVKTNRLLGALTMANTNSSIISGEDAGDMIEQYQQNYMTKDQARLHTAIPVLLTALGHVESNPSQADDRDTDERKGKYLASRTVKAFSGAQEWPHSVMVFALLGHRSFVSSDTFWYFFPRALVKAVASRIDSDHHLDHPANNCDDEASGDVNEELDSLVAMANNDAFSKGSSSASDNSGGTRMFKIGDQVVFVSQVDSYINRGDHFQDYSPLEFECIVDVLRSREAKDGGRGRPARGGFEFARSHPLYGFYEGFIRMKMHTPIFGGRPPPIWKDDQSEKKSAQTEAAEYILSTFTPWVDGKPERSFDDNGLLQLCREWDHSVATLINRQRYRYIRNVLQQGNRSHLQETIITDWRNRNVDLWRDVQGGATSSGDPAPSECRGGTPDDPEGRGVFSQGIDIYGILEEMVSADCAKRAAFHEMQSALVSLMTGDADLPGVSLWPGDVGTSIHGVQSTLYGGELQRIAATLQTAQADEAPLTATLPTTATDTYHAENYPDVDVSKLSLEQAAVVRYVVSGVDSRTQTLTMLHGAGGTGKSFVVRRITEEIDRRGRVVVATCPTGAGACQLNSGQTFHSAFKCGWGNRLSAQTAEVLKITFNSSVALVVVDEVSMFSAEHLILLNVRLQYLYDDNKPFGGASILLVGDFSQLPVVSGVSLCKIMYSHPAKDELLAARGIFQLFKAMFLRRQERARGCPIQQQRLASMRALPANYPARNRWSKPELRGFRPLTLDITDAVARPLTWSDIQRDPRWLDSSVILVTSNQDRAVMNASMARILAQRSRVILFRWRKTLRGAIGPQLSSGIDLLYNEDERPLLFAYFFKGARGQVLDNSNGNVSLGLANGTMCQYHSLAWDDDAKTWLVIELTSAALQDNLPVVDLPFPPDFINVVLMDRDGSPLDADRWPPGGNIARLYASSIADGQALPADNVVVVPIGRTLSKSESYSVKLTCPTTNSTVTVHFDQHAVDLAMALTIWKAQGATFDRVILHLEGSPKSPPWTFECIYVALSRVREANHIRCLPLSFSYDKSKLLDLRPNIFTVKWRMDVGTNGIWHSRTPAAD